MRTKKENNIENVKNLIFKEMIEKENLTRRNISLD